MFARRNICDQFKMKMLNKPPKSKKCKAPGCSSKFIPARPLQQACSIQCAIILADIAKKKKEASKAKIERREHRAAKEKLKTKRDWSNEIDRAFQEYCRWRDADEPCISCGRFCRPDGNESDGGHYITRGSKALRWNEKNCNKQCKYCNRDLKGNYAGYRLGMIVKYGIEIVDFLERRDHEIPKYTIPELIEIKAKYLKLTRELRKGRE